MGNRRTAARRGAKESMSKCEDNLVKKREDHPNSRSGFPRKPSRTDPRTRSDALPRALLYVAVSGAVLGALMLVRVLATSRGRRLEIFGNTSSSPSVDNGARRQTQGYEYDERGGEEEAAYSTVLERERASRSARRTAVQRTGVTDEVTTSAENPPPPYWYVLAQDWARQTGGEPSQVLREMELLSAAKPSAPPPDPEEDAPPYSEAVLPEARQ